MTRARAPSAAATTPDQQQQDGSRNHRNTILRVATSIQSISAIGFSAFLAMHLAAPLASALGLDASNVMLLTREYYQTSLSEPILVWGSLVAHIASSIVRRVTINLRYTSSPSKEEGKARRPPPPSIHSLAGYALVPLVIGHSLSHRIIPARRGLSPSLLSYSYVSYALSEYRFTSWFSYLALSVLATYHAAGGIRMMASSRRRAARLPDTVAAKGGWAVLLGGLGVGIVRLASEAKDVPLWLGKRYAEVLRASYGY